ncbi:MAG: nucleotide exchange factor GrpE [Isosphaeraceae bacterium]
MSDGHPDDEIEDLLERFRQWLEDARAAGGEVDGNGPGYPGLPGVAASPATSAGAGTEGDFGLIRLVEEFTALRHELKLQTKSTRGLIEQSEAMTAGLRQAIDAFHSVEPREERAAWSAGKALAEALADLDESLARGRREIERITRRLGEDATNALLDAVDDGFRRMPWIRRMLAADYHRQVQNVARGGAWLRLDLLEAIIEGYGLIQARLARVMTAERIARIECLGRPADPEQMVVLEVVDDPDHEPGTVLRELRSGYTWRGRLLRYAEVQAASVLSGRRGREVDSDADALALGPDADEDLEGDDVGDEYEDEHDATPEESEGIDLGIETTRPRADRPSTH